MGTLRLVELQIDFDEKNRLKGERKSHQQETPPQTLKILSNNTNEAYKDNGLPLPPCTATLSFHTLLTFLTSPFLVVKSVNRVGE